MPIATMMPLSYSRSEELDEPDPGFAGNLTAELAVNYSPKGTAVVSVSIDNN